MKFVLSFLVLCISSFVTFAQQREGYISGNSSESQFKEWFRKNILLLDPIEGVYSVRCTQQGSNAFITFPPSEEEVTLKIYKRNNGQIVIGTGEMFSFSRIGETNAYNVSIKWSDVGITQSKRIVLQNSVHFSFSHDIPYAQLKHNLGKDMAPGTRVTFKYDFIKKYPTASMYREAEQELKRRDEEKRAKILEEEAKRAGWTGTGWALKDGYIATNYHVIEDAKTINIQGVNGNFSKKFNAKVIATDKYNDLAILKIEDPSFDGFGFIPYSVKTSTSDVGEDIFVLGYPLTSTMGEEIKLTTGVISSKTGYQGDVSLYQISAPIQPGNSGGPLFDGDGNVIGIVSAKHRGAENVGYAIKASYLRNLMESALSENILPQTNKIASYKLSDKVKSLTNYVFYITCSTADNITSSYSTNYSSGEYSSSTRTYNNPHINSNWSNSLKVLSVSVQDHQTVIVFSDNNLMKSGGYYQYFTMDKNAYIATNGKRYKLIRAEGIAISPEVTYFSYAGETKIFTLYFPAIPHNTTSIDFIESESSEWKLHGIQLR